MFSKIAQVVWYFTRENTLLVVQIAQRLWRRSQTLFSKFVGKGRGLLVWFVWIWVQEKVKDAVSCARTPVLYCGVGRGEGLVCAVCTYYIVYQPSPLPVPKSNNLVDSGAGEGRNYPIQQSRALAQEKV